MWNVPPSHAVGGRVARAVEELQRHAKPWRSPESFLERREQYGLFKIKDKTISKPGTTRS